MGSSFFFLGGGVGWIKDGEKSQMCKSQPTLVSLDTSTLCLLVPEHYVK